MTATEIIDKHWLKDKCGTNYLAIANRYEYEFNHNMKQAQIELINMHYPHMKREDKIRANKYLKILQAS